MLALPRGVVPDARARLARRCAATARLRGDAGRQGSSVTLKIGAAARSARFADGDRCVETRDLTMRFGGVVAVDNVNFALGERELRCLIGPNGAGKSSSSTA